MTRGQLCRRRSWNDSVKVGVDQTADPTRRHLEADTAEPRRSGAAEGELDTTDPTSGVRSWRVAHTGPP